MTVSEYAVKFQSLSRFSLELVNTEEGKCRRFIKGLRHEIKRSIVTTRYERYVDLLDAARSVEEVDEEHKKGTKKSETMQLSPIMIAPPVIVGNPNRKRTRDSFQTTPSFFTFRAGPPARSGGNSSGASGVCHYCRQPGHFRSQCPQLRALPPPPRTQSPGACYRCGGFGHVARTCPQQGGSRSVSGSVQQPRQGQGVSRQQQWGNQSQPHFRQTTTVSGSRVERGASSSAPVQPTPGRVYQVSAAAPPPHANPQVPDTSVVRGTFLLFHTHARVLFDTGASHSFIAASFVHALELEPEDLSPPLVVATPLGGLTLLNRVFRDCELVIQERVFTFDFIVLGMAGFDLIVGMDWLSTYRATIDCFKRRVPSLSVRWGMFRVLRGTAGDVWALLEGATG